MTSKLESFTDIFGDPDEICDSQPLSLSIENPDNITAANFAVNSKTTDNFKFHSNVSRPAKRTGQRGEFRSVDEIDAKYRDIFSYPFFNMVQSRVIEDALYSDKSMVVCAPTGSGKTVVFEMAIVHLLMELEERNENQDFKIIYMAPVKSLCTERLTEWYSKFTKLGLLCIEVTGDTDVDFSHLKPYKIIITTPEKWDMLTRRWRDHRQLVELIKLFLIDEVHILNDETRGPVLEAVVSRMKTIEMSVQTTHRIEQLQQHYQGVEQLQQQDGRQQLQQQLLSTASPSIRFIAVSATVGNPEDVATWLGTTHKPAVYYKFGDECRPVKLRRVVEGYPCADGTSIFKFDIILNYKLWPIIQKYHNGKPTLIFCNTRKSVAMTAEILSREITVSFNEEQRAKLAALASTIKNKKLQMLVLSGVGCHHAGLLYEERTNIELAFRNRDLPILITTTTLAMGVNLPAHLVIVKNTQQYVGGAYQEYSISTVLQMVGRAGRPQFDTEATAVIMTRLCDKPRYQALVGGSEPLQSYLHKRLPENLNSEAALGTVSDVAQCVQWLRSTFLSVRAAKDPKRYLGLPQTAPPHHISKKIEELCVKAMNGLASSGLITMDEACCIQSTEAGRLMSIYYLDLETMKHIMKIDGTETLERLLWVVCESHELSDMHLRIDERRTLNALNRNNATSTIRFPMKGKITTRQMKLNCIIQAILGCLPIPDPSLNQEATKIMRIADRVCKCLVAYVTRPALVCQQPKYYSAILNTIILAKCIAANLWENSIFVSKQLKGIGPTFSTLLATAGKFNFMLLEESHPRDLERIMNKGPPAGNVLRKQISLLPKYQLTMTPIDVRTVSIQLLLLNHYNLAENIDSLTAGANHKSYVIIGDSENILLQLTSFRDKDLIGVYDGGLTYQVTRQYGFEHKIYAHCISSTFAGIDAQCEYTFKDLEPLKYSSQSGITEDLIRKAIPVKKQTTITDTFRERKRKNTDDEIMQSKEKKKRESALFVKFKNLKESFGKTSKVLKDDLDKSAVMSENILKELIYVDKSDIPSVCHSANVTKPSSVESIVFEEPTTYDEVNDNDFIDDTFMDEDKINDILNEIESEISIESSKNDNKTRISAANDNTTVSRNPIKPNLRIICTPNKKQYSQIDNYKSMNNFKKRTSKYIPKKSNYNFIDLLEKNIDLSDAEETTLQADNSFSNTIKNHIEKYMQKAKTSVKPLNRILDLIQDESIPNKEPIVDKEPIQDSNVIDKVDGINALNKTQELTASSGKLTIADGDFNNTSKQVSVLENKVKNIDLTTEDFLSIDHHNTQQIYEDNELPAVELLNVKKDFEMDSSVFVLKQTVRKLSPENYNVEEIITSNKNCKPEPMKVTAESRNAENIEANEPTNKDLENKINIVKDNMTLYPYSELKENPVTQTLVPKTQKIGFIPPYKYPVISASIENRTILQNYNSPINVPISTMALEKQNISEIDPPKRFDIDNRLINYSATCAFNSQLTSTQQSNSQKPIVPFVLSKTDSCVPMLRENLPTIENINNNAVENRVNITSYNKLSIHPALSQLCYGNGKVPLDLPSTVCLTSETREKQGNLEIESLNNNKTFTQQGYDNSDINNQNQCIKKYSFSSSKTDKSTQETAHHVVHVIRKLRIDLDITEIVIKDNKSMEDTVNIEEQIDDSEEPSVILKNPKFECTPCIIDQCSDNVIAMVPSHNSEYLNNATEIFKNYNPDKTLPKFCDLNSDNHTLQTSPDVKTRKQLLINNPKHVELMKTVEHCKENKNSDIIKNIVSEYKIEDFPVESKPNVKSILQKYSNIMRNSARTDFSLSQIKDDEKTSSAAKKEKPKRPFKISDIHCLKPTPLPSVIIEKPKTVNVTECFNLLEPNDKQTQLEQNKQQNIGEYTINTPKEQVVEQECSEDEREIDENMRIIEKIDNISFSNPLSCIESLEAKVTVSNIDQTMFNPKTLLQCFSKDEPEDIVPPPPEFSDDLNTVQSNADDETLPMDCYEPMTWEDESTSEGSIFQDYSQVNLTPSKEIETWNLPNDEDICNTYASPGLSPYSFTVMRKNNEQTSYQRAHYNSSLQSVTLPRRNKLKQFKFTHKNKFKM